MLAGTESFMDDELSLIDLVDIISIQSTRVSQSTKPSFTDKIDEFTIAMVFMFSTCNYVAILVSVIMG